MNVRGKKRAVFSGEMIPLPVVGVERTLGDVRAQLRGDLAEGEFAFCLCCGSQNKVYSRGLNSTMVRTLAELAKVMPNPLSSATITKRTGQSGGGDTAKLAYWGLIEAWPDHCWSLTAKGYQFLKGHIRLPHKALVYHDKLIGFDTSVEITVQDVVGKRFDIEEILASGPVKHSVVEAVA